MRSISITAHVMIRQKLAYRLPEGEEDDQLDAQHLHKRLVLGQIFLQLDVELDHEEHGYRYCQGLKCEHPDMRKSRVQRSLTISVQRLGNHRDNREEHSNEAVLEDSCPDDLFPACQLTLFHQCITCPATHIEPSQPTPRLPKRPLILPAGTLLQPKHPPKPILRHNPSKVILLLMQIRRDIMAQQRKETRNRKRLIAVPQHLEVDRFAVEEV